jgi:hypothetical protein
VEAINSSSGTVEDRTPTFYSLTANMSWTADGVQINFSGTANTLISTGGSLQSFKFTGAKGTFRLAMSGTGTTTWNTRRNSTYST